MDAIFQDRNIFIRHEVIPCRIAPYSAKALAFMAYTIMIAKRVYSTVFHSLSPDSSERDIMAQRRLCGKSQWLYRVFANNVSKRVKLTLSSETGLIAQLSDHLISLSDLRTSVFIEAYNPRSLPIAGVLVPVVARPAGPSLLLTKRSMTLNKHAGQIAFPGGRADPADADIVSTALREAWEETGISADFITPVGGLEPIESITDFLMVPTVAVVREGFIAIANPGEVDEIFEVPLEFVLNAANHVQKSMTIAGATRYFYSIVYRSYDIWGATARILVNLSHHLAAS